MAIPRAQILKDRAACPLQVQASLLEIVPPEFWPGPATVRARVERVFRGAIGVGETISIQINTVRDEPIPLGDFFYQWEGLRVARFIELCLDRVGDRLRLPNNSCSTILGALTEAPVLELPPRRRWPWRR
jgi:hypothetical protein